VSRSYWHPMPDSEADLGMFSMFGRTGVPQKEGPHKSTNCILHFLQHGNKPEILK